MRRNILKSLILEQQAARPPALEVERHLPIPIDKILSTANIVILAGVRRCGKSTLLQKLRSMSDDSNYYINFDDERLVPFIVDDFQVLMELFVELFDVQQTVYFDEIQNIVGWERFVRRLHDQGYKIYITGSNARMLSKELGTHLTGRYIQVTLYPFSFQEYLQFRQMEIPDVHRLTTQGVGKLNKEVGSYISLGGFPQYLKEEMIEYLQDVYESILYRDIVMRFKLTSEVLMKQLAYYLAGNVGKLVTFNSLKKLLGVGSANTISDYCNYLESAYLFFFVKRFNYSQKIQSVSPKKVYSIDTGMANAIGFRSSDDVGRMLENLVYIELKRRNYQIYYHHENKECDFVVCSQNKIKMLMQVCLSMEDENTQKREFEGLVDAMKAYDFDDGVILTLSESAEIDYRADGRVYKIKTLPVWQFLLTHY